LSSILATFFKEKTSVIDAWLDRLLPGAEKPPRIIHEAMRYSVFAGGKRLRPLLCIATSELFGVSEDAILPAACAIEMIHTYSLVHDDLPAMDDDTLRRGRPTCHVVYGEAMAILAGDALLTQAFNTLANFGSEDATIRLRILSEVSQAAGTVKALIGGQVMDLESEGKQVDESDLEEIHRAKTAAMIRCPVRVGAISGQAPESELALLTAYGEKAGLAFQIADDLLDETASSTDLGKTAGKDAARGKATYTTLLGVDEARRRGRGACEDAIAAARATGRNVEILEAIAKLFIERKA
jgi:geranylgeranyl diphosphate synthase, type II